MNSLLLGSTISDTLVTLMYAVEVLDCDRKMLLLFALFDRDEKKLLEFLRIFSGKTFQVPKVDQLRTAAEAVQMYDREHRLANSHTRAEAEKAVADEFKTTPADVARRVANVARLLQVAAAEMKRKQSNEQDAGA